MFPQKFAPLLFSAILSGLMSLLVSGITTLRTLGLAPDFVRVWLLAWLSAWMFAFPVVMVVAPLTRKLVQRLVAEEPPTGS